MSFAGVKRRPHRCAKRKKREREKKKTKKNKNKKRVIK